jgi:hypothetical protein
MTVHSLPEMTATSSDARFIAAIFRKLAEFREDYDERYLHELAAMLCRYMPETQADKVMSDALAMDNELRFRLPRGLSLNDDDDDTFTPADAEALTRLIAHAGATDHSLAAAAAEELGIENHRILRKCASVLALSLAEGGIEIGWEAPPAAMQTNACGARDVDFRL